MGVLMELKPFHHEGLLSGDDDLPASPTAIELRSKLAGDSARAHLAFIQNVPCLSRDDVIRNTGLPTHAASPAHVALATWKNQRHIFYIWHNGQELYPSFQFGTNGRPHPNVALILAALPSHRTLWQVAFWFVSPNGWLDGDMPANRLDDLQATLVAAQHEAENIEG
jgi:hypothetical protein